MKVRVQCLSYFVEGSVSKNMSKDTALFRGDCINTYFKVCKKRHFLGAYEHFFDIIAYEGSCCRSTCFKIACRTY